MLTTAARAKKQTQCRIASRINRGRAPEVDGGCSGRVGTNKRARKQSIRGGKPSEENKRLFPSHERDDPLRCAASLPAQKCKGTGTKGRKVPREIHNRGRTARSLAPVQGISGREKPRPVREASFQCLGPTDWVPSARRAATGTLATALSPRPRRLGEVLLLQPPTCARLTRTMPGTASASPPLAPARVPATTRPASRRAESGAWETRACPARSRLSRRAPRCRL